MGDTFELSLCVSKKLLVGFKCWFIFSMEWEWRVQLGEISSCLVLRCYDKKGSEPSSIKSNLDPFLIGYNPHLIDDKG